MFQAPFAAGSKTTRQSDIEAEQADIPILDDIVAALEPHLAPLPSRGIGSGRDQLIVGDDLRVNEATFDVAADHAGGLGRFRSVPNGPPTHLLTARREEGHRA